MNPDFYLIQDLATKAEAMTSAESPAAAFKLLLEAGRATAPRAAVFLIRQGQIQGWSSIGYSRDVAQALRAMKLSPDEGWFGELLADTDGSLERRPHASNEPDFSQPPATEALAAALKIKGKPVAVVLAERTGDEGPWFPEGLRLLVSVARLRLEHDVVLRRLQRTEGAPVSTQAAIREPVPAATVPHEVTAAPSRDMQEMHHDSDGVAVATSLADVETAVAPPGAVSEPSPKLDAARRYARLVATDIRLYNEDAVAQGRKQGDLAERLGEHLERGKETFMKRHGDLGPTALTLLHDAYVQVLAGGDASLLPVASVE